MQEISGRNRFVFPHLTKANEPMSKDTANTVMKRNGYKDRFTAHGMRALISTHLNAKGYPEDVVEAVLAHDVKGKTRKVYNRHNYLTERIEVMNYWGSFVEQSGWKL